LDWFFIQDKILLYIVSTPIGNLDDMSRRALQTLEACDAILCEDTRRSSILLERYGIRKRLVSYHAFKERAALEGVLRDLEAGKNLALISDAGTPCINDPGLILAQGCIERGIPFTAIPGPCSIIQALVLSGMETERFQFIGFLPRKAEAALKQALGYPGTTVAFESPERLAETLELLARLDPKRKIAVAREMTKTFEECRRGTADELQAHFAAQPPRGEIVLMIAGGEPPVEEMGVEELVEMLRDLHSLSLKEAVKTAARLRKEPKSDVYRKIHGEP
jgi:16S rRNA (cytidine1402-2'-O)-methyltransferase